ncbi:hypothetical protein Plhal304r1_c009g0036461 [Plasmopara halstedii]
MVGSQNRDIQSSFRRSRCARKSFLLLILGFNFLCILRIRAWLAPKFHTI